MERTGYLKRIAFERSKAARVNEDNLMAPPLHLIDLEPGDVRFVMGRGHTAPRPAVKFGATPAFSANDASDLLYRTFIGTGRYNVPIQLL
jgi:hypothetical protein